MTGQIHLLGVFFCRRCRSEVMISLSDTSDFGLLFLYVICENKEYSQRVLDHLIFNWGYLKGALSSSPVQYYQ